MAVSKEMRENMTAFLIDGTSKNWALYVVTALFVLIYASTEPAVAMRKSPENRVKAAHSHRDSIDILLNLRSQEDRPAVKLFYEKHPEVMKHNARALCEVSLSQSDTFSTDEAVALANRAVAIAPNDPYILSSLAYALNRNKSSRQALRIAAAALSLKKDARNYSILAEIQQSRGSFGQADLALKEAQKLDPDCFELTAARTRIALSRLNGTEAIQNLNQYLKRHPEDLRVWVLKSETLDRLGKLEESLECLDRVLKLKPTHTLALKNRAGLLQRRGKFPEAAHALRKLLWLPLDDGTKVLANVALAECLEQTGDLKGAVEARTTILRFLNPDINEDLNKGIFKNLNATFARETIALCRVENKNKQYDRALKKLNLVIKKFPTSKEGLEQRANAFEGLGKWQNALTDWTRLIELHKGYPRWYECRANAYEKLGDASKATRDRDTAAQLEREF